MYIFKHKQTNETRISTAGCATNVVEAWIWEGSFTSEWNVGQIYFVENEDCIDISDDGIVSFYHTDLERCIKEGKLILLPTQKIVENQIVDKTDLELFDDGVTTKEEYDSKMKAIELANRTAYFRGKKYKGTVKVVEYEANIAYYNGFFDLCTMHYDVEPEPFKKDDFAWYAVYFNDFGDAAQKSKILALQQVGLALEYFDETENPNNIINIEIV